MKTHGGYVRQPAPESGVRTYPFRARPTVIDRARNVGTAASMVGGRSRPPPYRRSWPGPHARSRTSLSRSACRCRPAGRSGCARAVRPARLAQRHRRDVGLVLPDRDAAAVGGRADADGVRRAALSRVRNSTVVLPNQDERAGRCGRRGRRSTRRRSGCRRSRAGARARPGSPSRSRRCCGPRRRCGGARSAPAGVEGPEGERRLERLQALVGQRLVLEQERPARAGDEPRRRRSRRTVPRVAQAFGS